MSHQESSSESTPNPPDSKVPGECRNTGLKALHSSNPKGTKFQAKSRSGEEEGRPSMVEEANPSGAEAPNVEPKMPPVKPELKEVRRWELKPVTIAAVVAGLFGIPAIFGVGFGAGQWWLKRQIAKQEQQHVIEFSAVAQGRLNDAMKDLREGNAKEALTAFQAIGKEFPYVPSLNYLSAVAAMQAGEMDTAEVLMAKSLQVRERESDTFALQAIMETQRAVSRSKVHLGDPTLRSEQLLWRAVLADPANPLPFIELATLLRHKGRHDEALKSLEGAQARLQPVDSHIVVDVTLELVRLEGMSTDQLTVRSAESDNIRTLMPAAYVALRMDRFDEAAATLKRCRGLMAADLYDYLVNDPAFRKFAYRSELQAAFNK